MTVMARMLALATLALAHVASALRGVDQAIMQLEKANSPLINYPTDFTQNIVPKMIHSHNDCAHVHLQRLSLDI
jgi:hypothetical protein